MQSASQREEKTGVPSMRVNWQLKTIWPVAIVLLAGMLLFLLSTVSLKDTERHRVLVIAGAGAVAICGVVIVALASTIQRPMIELQEQMERVGDGDLSASVGFATAQRRNRRPGPKLQPHGATTAREPRGNRAPASHPDVAGRTLRHAGRARGWTGTRNSQSPGGNRRRDRDCWARSAANQSRQGRGEGSTAGDRADQQNSYRLAGDGASAYARDAGERPEYDGRTRGHAVPATGALEADQDRVHRGNNLPDVEHDSDQIHQVLLNLLLNAVQAIEGSGPVRWRWFDQGDAAVVTVSDTGRGIPAETPSQYLPAVLHHQGKRHWARTVAGAADRRGASRADRSRQQFRQGNDFHSDSAGPATGGISFVSTRPSPGKTAPLNSARRRFSFQFISTDYFLPGFLAGVTRDVLSRMWAMAYAAVHGQSEAGLLRVVSVSRRSRANVPGANDVPGIFARAGDEFAVPDSTRRGRARPGESVGRFPAKGVQNVWVADAPTFSAHQVTHYAEDEGMPIASLRTDAGWEARSSLRAARK